jgi:hypothetical protein
MLNDPVRPASGARIPVKLHRRVCLVQTEDAVLAEELLARKKLAQDIVGRLTDRVLLIRPGRVEMVIQELQKMGHTPQILNPSSSPQRPNSSSPQRPNSSSPQRPNSSSPQRPNSSSPQRPNSSSPQRQQG